jgi:hypothetical protein
LRMPVQWKRQKQVPSGKHTKNYGKSQFLIGKLTISMDIFNSFLYVYRKTGNRRDIDVQLQDFSDVIRGVSACFWQVLSSDSWTRNYIQVIVMYIHVLNSELYILNHMCVYFIM